MSAKADNFDSDMLLKDPLNYRPGEIVYNDEPDEADMVDDQQAQDDNAEAEKEEDGEVQMEGGKAEELELEQFEGGYVDGKDVNPFYFLQHYNIYPRKPEEFIPDNRVF